MSANNKKFGLGRGLESLFGEDVIDWEDDNYQPKVKSDKNTVFKAADNEIEIAKIKPSPFQPRKKFDDDAHKALCDSVKEKGILQPLLLRPIADGYEIVGGERRWRAAEAVGLKTVPAVIRDLSDEEALEIALIENLQTRKKRSVKSSVVRAAILPTLCVCCCCPKMCVKRLMTVDSAPDMRALWWDAKMRLNWRKR